MSPMLGEKRGSKLEVENQNITATQTYYLESFSKTPLVSSSVSGRIVLIRDRVDWMGVQLSDGMKFSVLKLGQVDKSLNTCEILT